MAELCPGDTYSLSSKKSCNDDIEYIFVKLTDSAYRALQEYQRNQSRISATPAIQLQENGGHLSIPSAPQSFRGAGSSPSTGGANGNGQQQQQVTFSFTLSSNADIEGPQGSFECVQRRADRLDSLGALARKMRIHANEDVYEATRYRMAVAEENQKNKCTREIKPDQTDIGRKVKVKQLPQRPLNSVKPLSMIHPLLQQPSLGSGISRHSSGNNHNRQPPGSSPPPVSSNPGGGGGKPAPLGVLGQQQGLGSNGVPGDVNNAVNGVGHAKNGRISHAGRTNASNAPKSDVMRRPIKERLIHLLALRPYKKPELYSRINQEGIKEREKNCIATVLKQISNMRDNTYHLRRNIWNDVHDDWPFYTMDERALMKRRKPQNLTPPTSSDGGSSGSGQSPSSTHAGSPPQAISGNGGGPGKRQGSSLRDHHSGSAYDTGGGNWDGSVAPKKQRISHFRKPISSENNNNGVNSGSLYNRSSPPLENGSGYGSKATIGGVTENGYRRNVTDSRESSNMNPRSREDIVRNNPLSSSFISAGNSGSNNNNSNNINNSFHLSQNGVASQNGGGDDENLEPPTANGRGDSGHPLSRSNSNSGTKKPMQNYSDTSNNSLSFGVIRDPKTMGLGYDRNSENQYTNGAVNGCFLAAGDRQTNNKNDDKKRNKMYPKSSSPSVGNGHLNTQSTGIMNNNSSDSPPTLSERLADNNESSQKSNDCEPPQFDFSSEYTRIQSIDQRRKYKREFDENYDEYRDLHNAVDQVSQRFVALEERLRSVQPDSQEYKDIKRQIVTEYNQHLQDSRHTAKLNRYQYLHHKLSHIKRLVVAYDNEIKSKPV